MLRETLVEKLKEIGLSDKQTLEVMLLMNDVVEAAEVTEKRRHRDREAKKSSKPINLKNSAESAEVGRKKDERMWASLLQSEARCGFWTSKRVLKSDIPAEFIENFRAGKSTPISHETELA